MAVLRVLADDLTGALDSAARFVSASIPCVPTYWKPPRALSGAAAIDMGTREMATAEAQATADRLTCLLDDADPAFKKIDSLLRGHVAAEIAACRYVFDHVLIAPAFPFQGRITRSGRQLACDPEGGWRDVGPALAVSLAAEGVAVELRRPGDTAPPGTSLWDAETESDLRAVVTAGRALPGRVLWCGSGGLAGALAGGSVPPVPRLRTPVLALIGSDHPASIAQLSAAWAHVHRIVRGDAEEAAPIARRLTRASAAVAVVAPPGADRPTAGRHMAAAFAALLTFLDPPGALFVAGGETLRQVCNCLGAERLDVDGEIIPGVPASTLRGGRWDGLRVISKSGAFGDAGLLVRLLRPAEEGGPR